MFKQKRKIAIVCNCNGKFNLSDKACDYLGIESDWDGCHNNASDEYERTHDRDDPELIKCIENLGKDVNGPNCELEIQEIGEDWAWYIDKEYGDDCEYEFLDTEVRINIDELMSLKTREEFEKYLDACCIKHF